MIDASQHSAPAKRKPWLKILSFAIAIVAGFLVARGAGQLFDKARGGTDRQLAAALTDAAAAIRKQAPIKIDEVTTLNGAASVDDTVIYTMSLSDDIPADRIAEATALVQRQNTQRVCADANGRKLIDAGGKMRWIYTDASGDQFQAYLAKCP